MEVETEVPHAHSPADGLSFHHTTRGSVRVRVALACVCVSERAMRARVRECVHACLYVGDVTKSSLAANAFAEGDPWKRGREGGGASAVSMEREESMAKSRRWIPVGSEATR